MTSTYIIGYARVSEERKNEQVSVPGQCEWIKDTSARNGYSLVGIVREPKPVSAWNPAKTRPGYQKLLEKLPQIITKVRLRDPEAHILLMAREDTRLSRQTGEREELIKLCKQFGIGLRLSENILDFSTPLDKMTFRMTGVMAEFTSDMMSYKVQSQVINRVKEGRPHGGMPSIYERRCDRRTGKTIEWKLNKRKGDALRRAVEMLLDGKAGPSGYSKRAAWLYYRSLSHDNMGKTAFMNLLRSPTIAGIRTLRRVEIRELDGKPIEPRWEAIITPEQFERLKTVLSIQGPNSAHSRGPAPKHLLSGIAICGECRKPLAAWRPGTSWAAYRCETPGCGKVSIAEAKADKHVEAKCLEILTSPGALEAVREPDDPMPDQALSELRELEQRLTAFYDSAANGEVSPAALTRIEAQLLPRIETLRESTAAALAGGNTLANLASADAETEWENWSIEVRREAVRAALEEIRVVPAHSGRHTPIEDRVLMRWRDMPTT